MCDVNVNAIYMFPAATTLLAYLDKPRVYNSYQLSFNAKSKVVKSPDTILFHRIAYFYTY